ncbi:hypothetical protein LOK49_LG02G01450 [Camellia lanceoleosa]|uniref:Uncharacterized protein n=1 Tax=Camellia lanceoleosa TaxID=1840588 RepID=A0ACC0IJW6_9ERIC|nr:hypothetical protein LOK49_LG02G01450 [Camellia lanceoleosa]
MLKFSVSPDICRVYHNSYSGFLLLSAFWRFNFFPPFMVLVIAILNDDKNEKYPSLNSRCLALFAIGSKLTLNFLAQMQMKVHSLVACGGDDGAVECFDMRVRSSVGRINAVAPACDTDQALSCMQIETLVYACQMVPGQFFYRRWSWCGQRTNNCRVDLREHGRRKALWNFNSMPVLM